MMGAVLGVVALCVSGAMYGWPWSRPFPNRTVRIGLSDFPPYLHPDASGRPVGFVVELMEEAANRLDTRVVWVRHAGPSAQAGLDRGDFDVAPMLVKTAGRERSYAMSPVWWESSLGLLSFREKPISGQAGFRGVRIGILNVPFAREMAKRSFPDADFGLYPDLQSIAASLCSGETDAIVVSNRPIASQPEVDGCGNGRQYSQRWFGSSLVLGYSLASLPANRPQVEALYSKLVAMEMDGTFSAICQRSGMWNPRQSLLTREFVLVRSDNQWLWIALSVIGVIVAYLIWQNGQMRIARREAEAASQAKSRFLAMMSHEIRTPLNGVMGMSELLSASKLEPDQQTYVEAIRSSGSDLLNVLNDVLDFSRIEAGRMTVESIPFSPSVVAESAALLMNRRAAEKSLPVALILKANVPTSMRGDPTRFRQVLNNLLSNAIKFTETGWITVRVEMAGNGNLRVSVADTGVGIDPSVQRRLFEPFIQADSSIARKYGGTGLGLAICRQLVELMGGSIGVRSKSGQGSLFWFEVPAIDACRAASYETGKRSRIAGLISCPDLRESIEEMLAESPYLVEWLGEQSPPDVVCILAERPLPDPDRFPGIPVAVLPQGELLTAQRLVDLLSLALSESAPSEPSAPVAPLAGMRVLVAEDNRVNQRVVDSLLRRLGCVPVLAVNGVEAVNHVRRGGLDVVLMDLHMPEMDGLEAARQIRMFDSRIPILAFTAAHESSEAATGWEAAGMSGWIGKPLEFRVLRERLEGLRQPSIDT